jgi:tetratricopeptide (TPR) repeat protein
MPVYVLEFQTNLKGDNSSVAEGMTKAVETAFSNRRSAFNVLSRRELTQLVAQNKAESDLHAIERGEKPSAKFITQFRTAEGFVRGDMKNSVDGIVLTIAVVRLNSEVVWEQQKVHTLLQWLDTNVRLEEADKFAAEAAAALLPANEPVQNDDAPRGLDLWKAGNCRDATPLLENARAVNPSNVMLFVALGHCQNEAGDFSGAAQTLTSGITLSSTRADLFAERAKSFFGQKLYKRALDDLDQALKHDPGNVAAVELRGDVYMRLGQYDDAVSAYYEVYQRAASRGVCAKLAQAYRNDGADDAATRLEGACRP